MEHINPISVKDIIVVLSALIVVICVVFNTIHNAKRKPSADVDLAQIKEQQSQLKAELKGKQATRVCKAVVERIDGHIVQINSRLDQMGERHGENERDASARLSGVHNRIDAVFGEIKKLCGQFEEHSKRKDS